jgi:hypothetical protein
VGSTEFIAVCEVDEPVPWPAALVRGRLARLGQREAACWLYSGVIAGSLPASPACAVRGVRRHLTRDAGTGNSASGAAKSRPRSYPVPWGDLRVPGRVGEPANRDIRLGLGPHQRVGPRHLPQAEDQTCAPHRTFSLHPGDGGRSAPPSPGRVAIAQPGVANVEARNPGIFDCRLSR